MRKIVKEETVYTIEEIRGIGTDEYRFAISEIFDRYEDDFLTNQLDYFTEACKELVSRFDGSIDGFLFFSVDSPYFEHIRFGTLTEDHVIRYNEIRGDYMETGEFSLYEKPADRYVLDKMVEHGEVDIETIRETLRDVLSEAIVVFIDGFYETSRSNELLEDYANELGFEFYDGGELYRDEF